MVGGALACGLAAMNFKVAVVELKEPLSSWPADTIDLRVSALSRASKRILEHLGVWERITDLHATPYHGMEVWDAVGNGRIGFDAADLGEPELGHIVENRVTQLALWERLQAYDNVVRYCPDSVERFLSGNGRPYVELASGVTLSAHLVVAAEGANSPLREMAGIGSSGWPYDQHALVANVVPERPHGGVARQRFMPTGPLAFLPVGEHNCSIVWSTSPSQAERLKTIDVKDFCKELAISSEFMLGDIKHCGPRAAFPLVLRHADRYVLPGLALVGDAAHGIHPLAGQGVNLGFLDAAMLCDALGEAVNSGRSIGGLPTLRRYERARRGANMEMMALMDLFKRLFSNENPALTLVRNLGLDLVDASGPLKKQMARRAMGLTGELPKLAKFGTWAPGSMS